MAASCLSNVSSCYGAPMGRVTSAHEQEGKILLFRVRLNSGGYDSGGAYWGTGGRLYCARDEEGNEQFTRASCRADAARHLKVSDRLARSLTTRDEE